MNRSSDPSPSVWKNTILAGLANYIDAGSIVAGSAALTLWADAYHLSHRFLGLIAAFSANGVAAGLGALAGGYLCDRFGRKRIYQYDMIFYAFGMLWLVLAQQPWMIVIGFVLVGVAVGADIPASWSLIAETAPVDKRGAHSGATQALWVLGPLVVFLLFLLAAPLGLLGARLVFLHLLILALALTLLRSRMRESPLWLQAADKKREAVGGQAGFANSLRQLLTPQHVRSLAFLIGMYGIWNLYAGTLSFFFPYFLRTLAGQSQAVTMALQFVGGLVSIVFVLSVFMRIVDRVNQRLLLGVSIFIQTASTALLALTPLTPLIVIGFALLQGVSFGVGSPQALYQLWSAESFPTLLRGTAQGLSFFLVRTLLGIWSLFVPLLAAARFSTLVAILMGFLIVSGVIGVVWGPRTGGGGRKGVSEPESLVL